MPFHSIVFLFLLHFRRGKECTVAAIFVEFCRAVHEGMTDSLLCHPSRTAWTIGMLLYAERSNSEDVTGC